MNFRKIRFVRSRISFALPSAVVSAQENLIVAPSSAATKPRRVNRYALWLSCQRAAKQSCGFAFTLGAISWFRTSLYYARNDIEEFGRRWFVHAELLIVNELATVKEFAMAAYYRHRFLVVNATSNE
jgi:hypothetical protein